MKIERKKTLFALRFFVIAIVGMIYIIYSWTLGVNRTKEQAIKLARIVEAGFHSEEIVKLEATSKDLNKKEYLELKTNLTRIVTIHTNIRFAYIYRLINDKLYILVDSEHEYSKDYSPPGQEYTEAAEFFYKAADDSGEVLINNTEDRWGTFVSVLIPIEDPVSGKTIAVFGMDYIPSQWYLNARQNTMLAGGVVICVLLLFYAVNVIMMNNKALREEKAKLAETNDKLTNSERNNALLLMNLPGMAYRCRYNRSWTMEYASDGCTALTGYTPADLEYNRKISFNDLITEEYKEYIWDQWTKIIKNKTPFYGEYSIKTASGDIKWVYENGHGIYDEQGNIEAVEGIIIDISDRKKRENEIDFLNNHDTMTGLYNRRFFEAEKRRIDHEEIHPVSVIMGDINGLKLINDSFGHVEGDKLIKNIANILKMNCRATDILARTGGDEFSMFLMDSSNEYAAEVVKRIEEDCEELKQTTLGDVYRLSISLGYATKRSVEESLAHVIKDAEDNMYRHKMLQSRSLHSSILSSMKTTLFEKNKETEEHAHRLIHYSKLIGKRMRLMDKQLDELELLSTLHDIGKIGISDLILNKPGKLSEGEWAEMRKHPEIGYRIAMSTSELAPIAEYILYHHERWDGAGYPHGLKGEEIPLLSRIISIADAYDAMTEDRPYRQAMTKEEACAEIRRNSGSQFDPVITEIFLKEIEKV